MNITVRKYEEKDLPDLIRIWNEVVEDGVAFPQEEYLNEETGKAFFAEQTYTAAAVDEESGKVYGLYILHPNNIGRCGHICNASYAVVACNVHARHLYERLGFTQLGVIPKGFRMKDGHYEDICPYYHEL